MTTFKFVVIESPVLINAVLDAMWLDAVGTAGFVLEKHPESVSFFSPQHRAWNHRQTQIGLTKQEFLYFTTMSRKLCYNM